MYDLSSSINGPWHSRLFTVSLRASSPIWAGETRLTRPNRRACWQASLLSERFQRILGHSIMFTVFLSKLRDKWSENGLYPLLYRKIRLSRLRHGPGRGLYVLWHIRLRSFAVLYGSSGCYQPTFPVGTFYGLYEDVPLPAEQGMVFDLPVLNRVYNFV